MSDHSSEADNFKSIVSLLSTDDGAPDPPDASLHGLLMLSRGTSVILLATYIGYLFFQLRTHSQLFEAEVQEGEEEETADMDPISSGVWLVIITVVTAFAADVLVGSIDETAQEWKIPKRFIGLILLPLVGNAAEHVTSVWMACKGELACTQSDSHIAVVASIVLTCRREDGADHRRRGRLLDPDRRWHDPLARDHRLADAEELDAVLCEFRRHESRGISRLGYTSLQGLKARV